MVKDVSLEVYKCKREKCGYEWVQRPIVKRGTDGKTITKILLEKPKNCSLCKSEYWETGLV